MARPCSTSKSSYRYSYSLSPYSFQVSQGIALYPPKSGQNQANGGHRSSICPLEEITLLDHTPSMAGTFRKKFRKNSGKTQETLSERFLAFPSRVRLGCPKTYSSRHLRLPKRFQNSLPPQYGWGRFFFQNWFRIGPLRGGHGIPSSTGGISEL